MRIKIGIGYDIHRLQENRKLILGGAEIPFAKGLMGHSDGDCLIHAIIDALLGAIGGGDIGQVFPDTDPQYRNIQSTRLLEIIMERIREKNGSIHHVDCIVIAESPKIAPHIDRMKQVLCPLLQIQTNDLGIKAKTHEGIGPVGQGEAIAAFAQALIEL
ncbi:MAG: 2-C-methyl-D-erythritol 2,4-cyclodiphosphate synthase [Candidatus Aminicenantes bacterium]|nr:MAG: 2-C-methyl-D-erythritol 2,4-cyclodiphosphate synthase [Candidatus Aminicenantes bacterium]